MKATFKSLLVVLLSLAAQFSLWGQANDCYDIQCPSKIVAPCEGVWGAHVWYSVNATNRCNPAVPPTVTYNPPPGSIFPPGTNTACAIIQIPGLPPRQCCFDVIVDRCCSTNCIDVVCPRDILVGCQTTAGPPGALVDLPAPRAVNYCGDHTIPASFSFRCIPAPANPGQPVFFPPGTNTVVCCLTDSASGYINCCSFNVIVTNCPPQTDQCRPRISCPTDISIQCEGPAGGIVNFPDPKIIDPCHLVTGTTISHKSGSFFPNGKTTVVTCITWRDPLTGAEMNDCCSFDVVVRCCQPTNCVSRLDCPAVLTVDCLGPNGTPLNYSIFGTNTCEPTRVVCDPPPGAIIFGNTNVCCKLLNTAGISLADCCFPVRVIDTVPPTITCPPNMVLTSENCGPIDVLYPLPTASDNCALDRIECVPPSGSPFFPGIANVTCCAFDKAGNSNCCSFTVTVRCPSNDCVRIYCPSNILVDCAGPNGAVVNYTAYGTNVCTGGLVPVICSKPSGSVFPPGVTQVCCTNAPAGSTAVQWCCFDVVVRTDTIPPTIVCPSNIVTISQNCGPIDVLYPVPSATDNCALDHIQCFPPPGSPFWPGVTNVTCCAVDKAGNSSCCTFTVTVRCPTNDCVQLYCPSNIVVDCAGPNGAVVNYTAYGTNICTGGMVPVICSKPSGSLFPPGLTQVCCTNTVSTAGAIQWCCFDVVVRPDNIPPTITCPSNIVVISDNCSPIDVLYPAPIATDNCAIDYIKCDPPSGSPFWPGVSNVTCCAFDKAGNSSCCTFTVTVRCPSNDCVRLYCPPDMVVECAGPNGAVVNYTAYGTNICTGASVPVICSKPSGSVFPPGLTKVCCTNSLVTPGALQWCCFDVVVRPDTLPPVINCPSNIVVESPNCEKMDVPYPLPTATDNCGIDRIVCNPPAPGPFGIGITPVVCCAFDKAGNSSCCTFTVTVRCPSNDCVRIVCPQDILVDCAGPNGAVVNFDAYGTNICTHVGLPVICSKPSGSVFPPGLTRVCCTNAPITAANLQWCCFDVVVRPDTLPPVINCPSNIFILCAKPNGTRVEYKPTATDNCDPNPTITCLPPSGSIFHTGCTNVTCVAQDDAGNTSTCSFKVCVLREGCYLYNPSFELLNANLPAPAGCGDPIGFAIGWSALAGTPDLFRPPFASIVPGNCRGQEKPCQGTNYAGLEGGYTSSGGFVTEEMMGTLIAPLNNGQQFRLRACLSLAESSPGPVFLEFVLANSADPTQQAVIHQVWVTQRDGWMQYQPPCFRVPREGHWDRLIIRMAKVVPGTNRYQLGYAYIDNVNICCCKPVLAPPVVHGDTVLVTWDGRGQLQGARTLDLPIDWQDINTPVDYDPDLDLYSTKVPLSDGNVFFRLIGPDGETIECSECGG